MNTPTPSELQALLRGRGVDAATFYALLRDPQSRTELAQLAQVKELLEAAEEESPRPPPTAVRAEELALYAEDGLTDPGRSEAVAGLLDACFPEARERLEKERQEKKRRAKEKDTAIHSQDETTLREKAGAGPPPLPAEGVAALQAQAWEAFRRDLDGLLRTVSGQWVAYRGPVHLYTGESQSAVYQECLRRGYPPEELYVDLVYPAAAEEPTVFLPPAADSPRG